MTKEIIPESAGTADTDTDYIRTIDGAIMVEREPGWFASDSKSRRQVSEEDEDVKDGKRRVRTKRCNLEISTARSDIKSGLTTEFKEQANDDDTWLPGLESRRATAARRLRLRVPSQRNASLALLPSFFVCITPPGLGDTTKETLRNRAEIERYNADRPEKDYPEHTLWPRAPRNHGKPQKHLQPFWEYRNLNESFEPLQNNWLKADNDNYAESEEGDAPQPVRDVEAEIEIRPSPDEMKARWNGVHYETRQVGLITGPRLSDCGYCMAPTSPLIREMKIPVAGDVEVFGFHRDGAAHKWLGITATQKQVDKFVKRQHKNGTKQHNAHVWAWVDHAFKPRKQSERHRPEHIGAMASFGAASALRVSPPSNSHLIQTIQKLKRGVSQQSRLN